MLEDDKKMDLVSALKTKFPNLESLEFKCFEKDPITNKIVKWKHKPQPVLVEYEGKVKDGKVKLRVGVHNRLPMHDRVWEEMKIHLVHQHLQRFGTELTGQKLII